MSQFNDDFVVCVSRVQQVIEVHQVCHINVVEEPRYKGQQSD